MTEDDKKKGLDVLRVIASSFEIPVKEAKRIMRSRYLDLCEELYPRAHMEWVAGYRPEHIPMGKGVQQIIDTLAFIDSIPERGDEQSFK